MTTKTTKTFLFASLIAAMILSFSGMNLAEAKDQTIDTRNYFAEAVELFEENKKLEAELAFTSDHLQKSALESKIEENKQTIDELEALNIAAHSVDPTQRKQYDAIEIAFYDEYMSETARDNPVEDAFIDSQFRELIVIVDPEKMDSLGLDGDSLTNEYAKFISDMPGNNLTIKLEYGKFVNTACSARDASCDPVYGGLSVSNENEIGTGFSTMSYKAKLGTTVGFIMTGHGADADGIDIVQPDDLNRVIGTVDEHQENYDCDCAFVDIDLANYGINNEIYKNSSTSYSITGEVADASQTENSWVYKSGANTGVVLGQITDNSASKPYNTMYVYNGGGDSGAPIFDIDSGNDVDLYGMGYKASSGSTQMVYLRYFAYDHINSELGTSLP